MTPSERRLLLAIAHALAAIAPPLHAARVVAAMADVRKEEGPHRG